MSGVMLRAARKRIREKKLGELTLTEWHKGVLWPRLVPVSHRVRYRPPYLSVVVIVTLHLETLAQVHQTFIDFASLCQCRARGFGVPRPFGTYHRRC